MSSGDFELPEGALLGMGNPLLDIQATVGLDLLEKYGLKQNDAILGEEKHLPLFEELTKNYKVNYVPGGANQNVFRVFQWIVGKPNRSVFFGAVGDDEYGKILANKARESGVNVQYQINKDVKTGTCAALVYEHHRSLCADLAAANTFTLSHLLTPENQQLIKNAQYYVVSGFFITVCPEGILHVAEHAAKENKLYCQNLSAPFVPLCFKEKLDQIIPYVDLLFCNESEIEAYAQSQGWETKDIKEQARKLAKADKVNQKRSRIVVVTQGHDPVIVVENDNLSEYPVPVLPKEKIVDTTGAGDAFCGGFLALYLQGKSIEASVNCGIWAAAHVIANDGCVFPEHIKYEA
ncbi:unnamed protein product [Bursaphelenchus okinawaensis]|uniref:Adenosine kinase n=1 Tax=Bursaphelenchus okinawaensis TaxID=465554 RepID=A0A811LBX5_9BILA|nr:unnamed protein product [Bursaphelenchus okinawaensis]CAG9120408.1 unnamed protein product [Bursaphelenchus okinawaensis]